MQNSKITQDMSSYCDHKLLYASHNYDVVLDTDVGVKQERFADFSSKHELVKEKNSQFYLYICDCFGDIKKVSKVYRARVTAHVIKGYYDNYSESPSLVLLRNKILPLGLIAYMVLLVSAILISKQKINPVNINDHDYPFLFLFSAIGMQIMAMLFILIHTFIFKYNGKGFWLLDILGHCWLMAGDSCCVFLIILLARGWGTRFIIFPDEFVGKIFMVGSLVIVRYIWTIFSWYNLGGVEDGGDHIFDGVPGYLEIIIGFVKYWIYLVVWWQGYLKQGPIRGVEAKHWRRLDNLLFLAAFVAIVVRLIGITNIGRFEHAYHESIGLSIAIFCNFVMMVILSILMVPTDGPYKNLSDSLRHETHNHVHHHEHVHG
jgi:Rhodopsin-like GPCR transmembrane domain